MSAEASIPTPPLPGKDPPSTSPTPTPPNPPALTSSSPVPPASTYPPLSITHELRSMPPPSRPSLDTASQLQTSELPPVARPNFSPFFTLINDSSTQSTHHPSRIHYIFSDDDESEVLTAACIRSLEDGNGNEGNPAAARDMVGSVEGGTSSGSSATFKRGEGRERRKDKVKMPVKREERVIIVDVNETGDGIVSTSSLNSSWQVVNAEIANAPTLDHDASAGGEGGDGERGLMLRIEGVGVGSGDGVGGLGDSGEKRKGRGMGESSVMGEEEMQALMESFDQKMGLLRKIVESGEKWDEARREKSVGDGDNVKEV